MAKAVNLNEVRKKILFDQVNDIRFINSSFIYDEKRNLQRISVFTGVTKKMIIHP